MTCAACSAHVEKAVQAVSGVKSVSVSLLTNSMSVEHEPAVSADVICAAVSKAGYSASPASEDNAAFISGSQPCSKAQHARVAKSLEDAETPRLMKRLIASVVLLLPLMYVSMGHLMWKFPIPLAMHNNPAAIALYEMILAAIIMIINARFFTSGFKSALHGSPNMDTLVALGSGASFAYSTVALFALTFALAAGNMERAHSYLHDLYFESAAMILTLITVGKTLEAYSKGKTTDAIKSLMELAPETAQVVRGGKEETIPAELVQLGDTFIVRPGERIPVDGTVVHGESAVNEAALTGESIPVDKTAGSSVSAATLNQNGFLTCTATRVGRDTTLNQIIKMVENAAATKAPVAKLADKVSGIFVPVVIALALATLVVWLVTGNAIGFALARAVSVLVISCPCALGLATPVAIMVGSGLGAKHGILFKTAAALEACGKTDIVVLDKTGTVTEGKPAATDVHAARGVREDELLALAASLEAKSEHPLSRAVTEYAALRGVNARAVDEFKALPGFGVQGTIDGKIALGGNAALMKNMLNEELAEKGAQCAESGKTPLYFSYDRTVLGIIAVADVAKVDSAQAVKTLHDEGICVVMLTGDNKRTARAVAKTVGISSVVSDVLPGDKDSVVARLQQYGAVAMVGDGINDAPALTRADTGIAIGAGADVALDAADVVLMKSSLVDVCGAVHLSRGVLSNIKQNLFWAFCYNVIGIPVAAGALFPAFGIVLNPMLGALAMSLSSFCVVTNALRLNMLNIYKTRGRKKSIDLPEDAFAAGSAHAHADIAFASGNALAHADTLSDKTERTSQSAKTACVVQSSKMESAGQSNAKHMEESMTKTISIEGMMCENCKKHVEKALAAVSGVADVAVSLENKNAVVTLSSDVSDSALADAVTEAGYTAVGIA